MRWLIGLFLAAQAHAGIIDFGSSTYSSRVLTGNATTTLKTGSGTLHLVVIGNASTGGEIKIYDSTTGSGTLLLDIFAGTPSGGLLSGSGNQPAISMGTIDILFTTGLTAVTSGSTSNLFTVVYQ